MMSKIRDYKNLIVLFLFFFVTAILYLLFIQTPIFQEFIVWAQANLLLFFLILVAIKIVAIVWPPLPGGLLTLGSIPVIGWELAYLSDFSGSIIGSIIAFYLGKKYGYKFLNRFFDDKTIEKIKNIKIKKNRELESVIVLRIIGGTLVEVVCYGAGLLNIKFHNFIIGTSISHLMFGIPAFYLTSNILHVQNALINASIIVLAILFFRKIKGRYFE